MRRWIEHWMVRLALWLVEKYHIVTPGEWQKALEVHHLNKELAGAVRTASMLGNDVVRLSKQVAELDLEIAEMEEFRPHLPQAVLSILPATREEVSRMDTSSRPGTSGEYKRHVVVDQMMQRYPGVSKADIGLAIEWVVRK